MQLESAKVQCQIEFAEQLRHGAFFSDEAKRANEIRIESKNGAHVPTMVKFCAFSKGRQGSETRSVLRSLPTKFKWSDPPPPVT